MPPTASRACPISSPADTDLIRRGRWLDVDCRIDVGSEPFFLPIRKGVLAPLERGARLMRSTTFSFRATDEAWTNYWAPVPAPGWHDLFALDQARRSLDGRRPAAAASEPAVLQIPARVAAKSAMISMR